MVNFTPSIPLFLSNETEFVSHLQCLMEGLSNFEMGERFAKFSQHLLPHTDTGNGYSPLVKRQASHDGGVDLEAKSLDGGEELFVQTKYTIKSVDELDSIMSKFASFEEKRHTQSQKQQSLFTSPDELEELPRANYVIFTASAIDNLITKYERSERPSLGFYLMIKSSARLTVLGRTKLYSALKNAYRRTHLLPENVSMKFSQPFIAVDGVIVGIIDSQEIRRLYTEFGDALFLENIREWLGPASRRVQSGPTRETPNQAIARTLASMPDRFLARNNGITMRASKVTLNGSSEVLLDQASIVNGCQTTMAIVAAPATATAKLLVKIVETEDSWDIAQAANFQNEIKRIELELARDLRPQLIRNEASKAGYRFISNSDQKTAFSVMEELFEASIVYEEFESLFVGLFSRSPNNVFDNNYAELRQELLAGLNSDAAKEDIYEDLFKIHFSAKQAGLDQAKNPMARAELAELFQRFWKDDKHSYRTYLTLLAMMRVTSNAEFHLVSCEYANLRACIRKAREIAEHRPSEFVAAYILAFKAVALQVMQRHQDRNEQLQAMYKEISGSRFDNLLGQMDLIAS